MKSKGRVTLAGAIAVWLVCSLVFVARPITAHAAVGDVTTIAGNGSQGYSGDGGPATAANLHFPIAVARDTAGNLYISDYGNNVVRKVDTSGTITTFAGTGAAGYSGDGSAATAATLNAPGWVAVDSAGNVLICDDNNNVIRRVDTSGKITTVAGTGTAGYGGDNGPATSAQLNAPNDVTVLPGGGFILSDYNNNRVRKVDTTGKITTIAGNGTNGYTGDGGLATSAEISGSNSEGVDAAGDVYLADFNNNVVRKIDTSGIITTIAGNGTSGYSGDGGPATAATTHGPAGIAVYGHTLYFTDYYNNAIREVDATGTITSVAAGNLLHPQGLLFDPSGDLIIADTLDQRVQEIQGIGNDLLSLSGSAPASVTSGQPYAYTLTMRNPGGVGNATGVTLTDTLPAGLAYGGATATQGTCTPNGSTVSCAVGAMAVGATVTVTINVTAPSASTSLTNKATVSANEADPVTADNTVSTTTLVDVADLSVTAAASPPYVVFGNPVTFTVGIQNAGPADATNTVVTNSLSAGLTIQSISPSQGTCAPAAASFACNLGTVANGASATVTIIVVPPMSVQSASENASVTADQLDPNTSNNTATAQAGVGLTTFNQFPVGRFESPQGLAFGPDGNAYVSESSFDNEITQVTTSGVVRNRFSVSDYNENFITRGPDGNLWFTESGDLGATAFTLQSYIGRLTTSGQLTEFPLPTPFSRPYAIAAGGDGNVWFTEDASQIGRITPQGVVTEFPIPTQQAIVDAIALGPDGNMWFTESRTDKVARIDAGGHVTEFDLPSGAGPEGLVTGPDHNLWIVESGSNNIAQLNVNTHSLTEFPIPSANSEPEYIAVGPDGNLYFTEANFFVLPREGRIGRVSTNGSMLEIPIPNGTYTEPWDIVAGPDGNMWFTEEYGRQIASMAIPSGIPGTQETGKTSTIKVSAHQPTPVTQLQLPETTDVAPFQEARGPDGSLYFTERFHSVIGRIGPGGKITEIPAPLPSVGTIAFAADGNLWYCDNNNGLDRLNPSTGKTTNFPTPSPDDCHDVVADAHGNLWYDNPSVHNIGKMTTSGVATEYPINSGVSSGPGGSVWVMVGNNIEFLNSDATIAHSYAIPASLQAQNFSIGACCPTGADGNMWFGATTYDPNTGRIPDLVGRLNLKTGAIDTFKTGMHAPATFNGITAAPDGNLWLSFGANDQGPAAVLAVNTSGQVVSRQFVPAGFATPGGIAVGPSLTNNKNGWAVYMAETAINSFAVVQGNGG